MLSLASIEEVCEAKRITLVMHPAIRRALKPYGESFYVGACCFLRGETNGLYFLPPDTGDYLCLPGLREVVIVPAYRVERLRREQAHNVVGFGPELLDGVGRSNRHG